MSCFSSIAVFDQLDVVSYEEVVRLPAFKRKTLVLIGRSCPGILCSTGAVCWNQGEPGLHRGWDSAALQDLVRSGEHFFSLQQSSHRLTPSMQRCTWSGICAAMLGKS